MELHSKKDIEKVSITLLKESKAFDTFPTPIDRIVEYSELIINNDVNLASIHESYLLKATDSLFKAIDKLRGLFDRTTRTIYIDQSLPKTKRNFVKLHEVGHGVLPWQMDIHQIVEDDDQSLSPHVIEEFEMEANYFASVTLFQHDRFQSELSKLSLGMESAIYLSKHFGASIHATLRRFIDCSSKRCALIVLEKININGIIPACIKRDFFSSASFLKTFGHLYLPDSFDMSFDFFQHYLYKRRGVIKGVVNLETQQGSENFNYHFFNNTFNAFVFIFPIGEKNKSRTKIILSEKVS